MLDGAADALIKIFSMGISVYVASIELSAHLHPFPEVHRLMSFATRVEKCTAVCQCGADAQLTMSKVGIVDRLTIGGDESYEAACWRCHPAALELCDAVTYNAEVNEGILNA